MSASGVKTQRGDFSIKLVSFVEAASLSGYEANITRKKDRNTRSVYIIYIQNSVTVYNMTCMSVVLEVSIFTHC